VLQNGIALFNDRRFPEAAAIFQAGVGLDPDHPEQIAVLHSYVCVCRLKARSPPG